MYNNEFEKDTPWDDLHEECGVFGMYDFDGGDVASTIYYGLFALQHRGQESCGIAVSETDGPKGKVTSHKGMGLVNEVFAQDNLEPMKGDIGVGHVRYSTAGASTRENAQPLVLNYVKGTLALAHNGNLINAMELRKDLEYTGAIFQTTIDSEVIAYHIARERLKSKTVEEAVGRACRKLKGAYSLVVMSPRKLIGARDPFGFKPLCIGKRDNAYILASESCALETIGADFVRDVLPGEVVTITPENGIQSDLSMALPKEQEAVAETIENNIGKEIVERTQSNPKYYEKMSALLRELIEKRKNDVINYEEYLRQIVELARKVHKPESGAEYPPEIRESAAKRAFYDHLNGDAVVANQIYDAVMSSKQDNFRGSKIKERKIWRAIRAIVKDDQEADRLLVLVKEQSEF